MLTASFLLLIQLCGTGICGYTIFQGKGGVIGGSFNLNICFALKLVIIIMIQNPASLSLVTFAATILSFLVCEG